MCKETDLFEELQQELGCMYISDMRFSPYQERAKELMRNRPLNIYSLRMLSDAAEYLYRRNTPFNSLEQAEGFFRNYGVCAC